MSTADPDLEPPADRPYDEAWLEQAEAVTEIAADWEREDAESQSAGA